ncbi:MAG: nitroreductase family protein [Actinomycetota bacterium]
MTRSLSDLLASRRMCRDFSPEPIGSDILDPVLAAAFAGPRAGNTHGIHLVVLEDAECARYWDVTLPEERRSGFRWPGLLRAPVLAVVVVDVDAYVRRYGESDKVGSGLGSSAEVWAVPYWFVDAGSAAMAVLLAAEAAGLGALWFALFDHEAAVAEEFGVPAGFRAVGTLALGRRAPGPSEASRSSTRGRPDPLEFLHRGGWA